MFWSPHYLLEVALDFHPLFHMDLWMGVATNEQVASWREAGGRQGVNVLEVCFSY